MKKPGKMLREVLMHVLAPPATVKYPLAPAALPKRFRGRILFSWEKCIGCHLCEKDCPSDAIKITKVAEKRFEATFYLDRCMYCAQCVDTCPKNALEASPEFELAQARRESLEDTFHAPLPTPEELAREAEAKKKAAEAKAAQAAKASAEKPETGKGQPGEEEQKPSPQAAEKKAD